MVQINFYQITFTLYHKSDDLSSVFFTFFKKQEQKKQMEQGEQP
jgi:hypothetical protein